MAKEGLYSIGKVSKICDVSPRTLRYYEEVGLLQPDRINERSGYRYYSAESMYQVQVIRYLSDEGFSLEEIGQILLFYVRIDTQLLDSMIPHLPSPSPV